MSAVFVIESETRTATTEVHTDYKVHTVDRETSSARFPPRYYLRTASHTRLYLQCNNLWNSILVYYSRARDTRNSVCGIAIERFTKGPYSEVCKKTLGAIDRKPVKDLEVVLTLLPLVLRHSYM